MFRRKNSKNIESNPWDSLPELTRFYVLLNKAQKHRIHTSGRLTDPTRFYVSSIKTQKHRIRLPGFLTELTRFYVSSKK